jgi:hypothetical protein
MPDTGAGTTLEAPEAPAEGTQTPETGTQTPDEVTTLRSRNAGLDAKVTELTRARAEAERVAAEAATKLSDYESGKVQADEALRAQLSVKEQELAAMRQEVLVAGVAAKFPETFALFGAAVSGMTPETLAASEARLTGAGFDAVPETPRPVGANPARPQAPTKKAIEDMDLSELRAHLRTFPDDILGNPQ